MTTFLVVVAVAFVLAIAFLGLAVVGAGIRIADAIHELAGVHEAARTRQP